MVVRKCIICNKKFLIHPCRIKKGNGKFCSKKCCYISKKGKPSWNKGTKGAMPTPWNKGCKGIHLSPSTEFKEGNIPAHKGKKLLKITGDKHWNWQNGKRISRGYTWIYNPKHPFCGKHKCVPEHRLIVERQIGRYLLPKEKVHHLGKKSDNRPQMLMAFINHSVHLRFENNWIINSSEIIFDGRKLIKSL